MSIHKHPKEEVLSQPGVMMSHFWSLEVVTGYFMLTLYVNLPRAQAIKPLTEVVRGDRNVSVFTRHE